MWSYQVIQLTGAGPEFQVLCFSLSTQKFYINCLLHTNLRSPPYPSTNDTSKIVVSKQSYVVGSKKDSSIQMLYFLNVWFLKLRSDLYSQGSSSQVNEVQKNLKQASLPLSTIGRQSCITASCAKFVLHHQEHSKKMQ